MKIKVENITFAASHFIIGHETCSRMHGHNYRIDVEIEHYINKKTGFVIDFKILKEVIKDIVDECDHKVMLSLPIKTNDTFGWNQKIMQAKDIKNAFVSNYTINGINYHLNKSGNYIEFGLGKYKYKMPAKDIAFLRIPQTTAEHMAQLFANIIKHNLLDKLVSEVKHVVVTLYETPTSCAIAESD